MGGTTGTALQSNGDRGSGMVLLLPYFEQSALYNQISSTMTVGATTYQPFGDNCDDATAYPPVEDGPSAAALSVVSHDQALDFTRRTTDSPPATAPGGRLLT